MGTMGFLDVSLTKTRIREQGSACIFPAARTLPTNDYDNDVAKINCNKISLPIPQIKLMVTEQ